MSRYTGPSWKKSRRLGMSLTETGKELAKRNYAPGQHGQSRKKLTEYGIQLQEKQRVRFMYGVSEKQFRKTFDRSSKMKGVHGVNFLIKLESRLDNIVYRMGLARTRRGARQLVNHGHIAVDGQKVDVASYDVKPGQVISMNTNRERSTNLSSVKDALEYNVSTVAYVSFDKAKCVGKYERYPERSELNPEINEQLIVEFYNR